ncbi:MAG: 2-octaprenyl-6-methoxyphenyl hydroxylase [Halioglobus sp.]
MIERRDIVIAGGGMVGVSLALQLGAALPDNIRILLVEGFPFPEANAENRPDYHPSFDARSTALSFGSRLIYEQIGVWSDLEEWLCPIETIHVSNKGRFGSALMKAADYQWHALGYVVENAWLGNTLIQSLYRQGRVELVSPAKVIEASSADGHVNLKIEGEQFAQEIEAGLLLVADGANSGLREQLGVAVDEKQYRQHAIVANVAFTEDHRGCAYERFTDDGPVAFLPLLPTRSGEHRAGVVWTLPPDQSELLQNCDQAEFLAGLQEKFGYRLGRLTQVGQRHSYPLALIQSAEQVRNNIVVMGNAAHALHPVAGQGYNLALRDVAVLGDVLAQAAHADVPLGDLAVLSKYESRQKFDQARTVQFSDKLPSLFMYSDPLLGLARDLGLSGLDILPSAKRAFVRQAAGMANLSDASHG